MCQANRRNIVLALALASGYAAISAKTRDQTEPRGTVLAHHSRGDHPRRLNSATFLAPTPGETHHSVITDESLATPEDAPPS